MSKAWIAFLCGIGLVALQLAVSNIALAQAVTFPKETGSAQPGQADAEIARLIAQLGDEDFLEREKAFKRLQAIPGVLEKLRPFLTHEDLETRKRVQLLVEELSRRNFSKLFQAVVRRKQEAPLDLLVDLVTQNQEAMGQEEWKAFSDTVEAVQTKTLKDSKVTPRLSEDIYLLLNTPSIPWPLLPEELIGSGKWRHRKIVGTRIVAKAVLIDNAFVSAGSIELWDCGRSVVLANGGVSATGSVFQSFILSDGDITCRSLSDCMVIVRGEVKADSAVNNIIVKGESSAFALFSMRTLGLAIADDGGVLRVDGVAPGSPGAKCGIRVGDTIIPHTSQEKGLVGLVRASFGARSSPRVTLFCEFEEQIASNQLCCHFLETNGPLLHQEPAHAGSANQIDFLGASYLLRSEANNSAYFAGAANRNA